MKKVILTAFVAAAFAFGMTSCNNKSAEEPVDSTATEQVAEPAPCTDSTATTCDSTCKANCPNGANCKGDKAACQGDKACCKDGKTACKDGKACAGKESCKNSASCPNAKK